MKFENKKKADLICRRIEKLKEAKVDLVKWRDQYTGDSDGSGSTYDKLLYNFRIHAYRDGSGDSIDLTGCLIGYSILTELESKIDTQINKDLAELETL